MTTPRAEPAAASAGSGPALSAALACYVIWGLVPLVFQLLGDRGVGAFEILAHRTLWATPTALVLALAARQSGHLAQVLRSPRTLAWLALSSALVAVNWSTFIWAVNSGRVLETSLGYYILPLINMAAGALIFRERLDRLGLASIGLAAVGVVLQAAALGHVPIVSIVLALSFGGYGIVRKRVPAEAQTGLLVECAMLAVPCGVYALWLQRSGGAHFLHDATTSAWLVVCGPMTAVPLALFAWAARRIPLSAMGFLQFITPTMTFFLGVEQGESLTPLRAVSFALIWAGVSVFAFGTWRRGRRSRSAASGQAAPVQEAA